LKVGFFSCGVLAIAVSTCAVDAVLSVANADGYYACGVQSLPPTVISVVKKSLARLGFNPGTLDSKYDAQMYDALIAYQRARMGSADKDLVMVTDLLNEAVGEEEAKKLLPPPLASQAKRHGGLECTW